MDLQTELVSTGTASALSHEKVRFNQAEDSGYHTFTPGSFESSGLSYGIVDQCGKLVTTITGQIQIVTPDVIQLHRRYHGSISNSTPNSPMHTPPIRRTLKRPYCSTENADAHINGVPTPTSYISGKIQSLHVNDKKELNKTAPDNSSLQLLDCAQISEYPTTPVKRNCKVPCKRSAKKLDFTTHSLLCETNGLQYNSNNKSNKKQYKKLRIQSKTRTNLFKSDPKIDIISRLYQECGTGPPIMKILNFISYEDILNFNLVSRYWNEIWEDVSEENILKQRYRDYLRISKENLENKEKGATPKKNKKDSTILKDIQNDLKDKLNNVQGFSPPSTPRSHRFKKFTKTASLDTRLQMSCVRCSQPGKVTEELSGEVWVGCTSSLCGYQFCKFCTCDRHPGKFCFQYDLNGPSPSKRKKTHYGVCSRKSRRNLQRLL